MWVGKEGQGSLTMRQGEWLWDEGDYETRGTIRGFIEGEGCDYMDIKELPGGSPGNAAET